MKNIGMIAILLIFLGFLSFLVPVNATHSEVEPIFSIRVTDFKSPVTLGKFLEFSYFTKGVSGVDGIAKINFWIEKNGKAVTSGTDTIYLGKEEKTTTADIFLPSSFESGIYELHLEADYKGHMAHAYRTIEINVEGGIAIINLGFGKINVIIIFLLIVFAVLNIYIMYHFEKKKIKELLLEEERFFKRHKMSFLTISFFIILGILVYYLNLIGTLPGALLYYYLALAVFLSAILSLEKLKKRLTK